MHEVLGDDTALNVGVVTVVDAHVTFAGNLGRGATGALREGAQSHVSGRKHLK